MFFDFLILFLVLSGIAVSLIYCLITGISPVSSTCKSRKEMINSVPRNQEGYIYELGAGWGALAFPVARRCPKATVVAYELSPIPWLFMKIRAIIFRPRNLILKRRNFLKDDLSKASLILCYLYPQAMVKLSPKLATELKPTTQIICNTFELPAWIPSVVANLEDVMCPQIFYYKLETAFSSAKELLDVLANLSCLL
jgi:16S rRNA A1518/A1519 N6-dimethyltransferase RsmA/KsgA/DIM1 with predicted DNA glycosylase/AP lyase activity